MVKREHLRDGNLGQDLIRADAQRKVGAGKSICEALRICRHGERRLCCVGLRELLRRQLREPLCLHDFQPHGTIVHDAEESREPGRILGPDLERIDRLRKCADGRLRLDCQRKRAFLRLIELHVQPALAGHRAGFHVPRQNMLSGHPRDLARSADNQRHRAHFALHHRAVDDCVLPHQSGADADLRKHDG